MDKNNEGLVQKEYNYQSYRRRLPKRLRDEFSYNLRGAYDAGYNAIGEEHLPTRNYKTGEILKKPWHPTFLIGLNEDAKLGYYPQFKNNKIYTNTWKANEK